MSHRSHLVALLVAAVVCSAGCARSPFADDWVPARPLASDSPAYRPSHTPPADIAGSFATVAEQPTGQLTLAQVWKLALLHHPALAADAWEVRAAEARRMQADVMPNPSLDVRLDDFGGSGERQSFDEANLRVRVTQVIELGDKRKKRVALADADRTLAAWDYETRRVAVAADVTDRFVTVLEMQERVALRDTTLKIAMQMQTILDDRIKAGIALPAEQDQSSTRIAMAKIELTEAQIKLDAARRQLANTWNSDKPQFTAAVGSLDTQGVIDPGIDALLAHLADHPEVARFAGEVAQRQAALALARAEAVPDVKVGAGARYFRENDDQAFLVEFEIPLPLFDRRSGDILEKRFAVARARAQGEAARSEARAALIDAHRDLAVALDRANAIATQVLPPQRKALETTENQFKQGLMKFDDLLDAHRDLQRAENEHLKALGEFHQAAARVEGLIGRTLR